MMPQGTKRDSSDDQALHRLRRTLMTLSACNHVLIRANDERQLATALCRALIEVGGFCFAWVGYIEHDSEKTVRPIAAIGPGADFIEQAKLSWADVAHGRGPSGRAIRTGKPWTVSDIATNPNFAPWRDQALACGLRSCISIPLTDRRRTIGVLGVYADAPDAFDRDAIGLLSELGDDLSFGLINLRDREARKAAEEQLLRNEVTLRDQRTQLLASREHLARAQRVGRIGSAEVDIGTGAVTWSDGLYALLGLDPARTEPSFEVFLGLLSPEWHNAAHRMRESDLKGVASAPLELEITRPDGEKRWLYRQVELVDGDGDRPKGLIVTLQDVTDRRRIEEELRRSREHLSLAQRIGRIGSIEFHPGSRCSHWSDEMYALLGTEPSATEPNAEALIAVTHPDDRDTLRKRREKLSRGQENAPYQFRIVRPDNGDVRWLQVQSAPITANTGELAKVVATFQDVTELREAQLDRAEIERQLMRAQKMEAVGNLTGGIAHDFNNLLTVILGRLDLVETELADRPELREWIRICASAARRGAALTRSMMAFARQQPLRPVAVDLAASVDETVGLLRRTLGESIEIKIVYDPELWRCDADPSQLQSALVNLALNARDAMPNGGKLTIDAHNLSLHPGSSARQAEVNPGDYVVLSVSDTGVGMATEIVERACEPFFTTKEVGKGSGLGLSMVYGFAKQSHGQVKIDSEPGQGTAIRLYLPRATDGRTAQTEAPRRKDASLAGGSERILVVEDDADMRDLSVALLQRLGYQVVSASNAEEALPLFEAHPDVALLLTDVSLPGGINGRQLADRLVAARPSLKVLYMSGYSEDAVMHEGRLDPDVRLLQKPFQNEELALQVRGALSGP